MCGTSCSLCFVFSLHKMFSYLHSIRAGLNFGFIQFEMRRAIITNAVNDDNDAKIITRNDSCLNRHTFKLTQFVAI